MKPRYWSLFVDGNHVADYAQRAAANGAAMLARARGSIARVDAVM